MKTALLFDLDGTLVDSDTEHLVAFQRVFAPHGIELSRSEYAANIMGASNEMIASRYLSHLSLVEQAAIDIKGGDSPSGVVKRLDADPSDRMALVLASLGRELGL